MCHSMEITVTSLTVLYKATYVIYHLPSPSPPPPPSFLLFLQRLLTRKERCTPPWYHSYDSSNSVCRDNSYRGHLHQRKFSDWIAWAIKPVSVFVIGLLARYCVYTWPSRDGCEPHSALLRSRAQLGWHSCARHHTSFWKYKNCGSASIMAHRWRVWRDNDVKRLIQDWSRSHDGEVRKLRKRGIC